MSILEVLNKTKFDLENEFVNLKSKIGVPCLPVRWTQTGSIFFTFLVLKSKNLITHRCPFLDKNGVLVSSYQKFK